MNQATMVFSLPGNEELATLLAAELDAPEGIITVRDFPDGESYVRGETQCEGLDVVLAANLYQPNPQVLPLIFCTRALRVLGARRVLLVTPYLPYMRQDARFQPGEVITSRLFAELLSSNVDGLVTVDPHLHRYSALDEIYSIPARAQRAAPQIAAWIQENIDHPVIIGPDSESEQWVSEVADMANAPFLVLTKTRRSDRDVEITVPPLGPWSKHTPVLVDDIISTARTMIETVGHLKRAHYPAPVCIGVHAVFSGDAYAQLIKAGTAQVVTCNTVPHPSNAIDLTIGLAEGVRNLFKHQEVPEMNPAIS